jgi:hypothetical protein
MRKFSLALTALLAAASAARADTPRAIFDFEHDWESNFDAQFEGLAAYGAGNGFVDASFTLTYNNFAGTTIEATYWDDEFSFSQAFLFVQSDVGRLESGWAYNMARKLGISPPDVGPLNLDDEYLFMNPRFLRSSHINTDEGSVKVNFMAEGAEDLVFAASYGPRSTSVRTRDRNAEHQDFGKLYAGALKYDIGEFGVSAGVVRLDNWNGGNDLYEYSFGTKYYDRGFQLSAAWRHVPANSASVFHLGGAYEFGPIEASLTHLASRMDRDWANVSMLSSRFRVNKMFAVSASVGREGYTFREELGKTGMVAAAGVTVIL